MVTNQSLTIGYVPTKTNPGIQILAVRHNLFPAYSPSIFFSGSLDADHSQFKLESLSATTVSSYSMLLSRVTYFPLKVVTLDPHFNLRSGTHSHPKYSTNI